MRRILRLAALPILALSALVPAGAGPAAAAAHSSAAAASCTGTIQIDSFAFSTPVVTAGQTATAKLVATNCTAQPVSATVQAYGRFFGSSGNPLPPGCPVVDPIALPANFAPNGQYTNNFGILTFAGCSAASYQEYVSVMVSGTTVASATATVAIQGGASSSCHVVYTKQSEWQGGFVAAITITNTGTLPISYWRLTFAFGGDQHISYVWGASFAQTGNSVTLVNTANDGTIAPGATLSAVGFVGSWQNSDAPPSGFTLNGVPCA